MDFPYTAVIQRDGPWWIGWVKELPGVNSQGRTREELIENLRSALKEALEMNRAEALAATTGEYEEVGLNPELGTICWPNEADLDPDVLYSMVTGEPLPRLEPA